MEYLTCAQLNSQHCKAAMAYLSLFLATSNMDILFNQEPYCYNGVPAFTPSNYTPFYVNSNINTRACIYIKNDIAHNFLLMHNFSTPDNTILISSSNPPIYLASSYLPPHNTLEQDLAPIENVLTTIRPTQLIWGLDSNCHHILRYSPTMDIRGRKFVDFAIQHGLIINNEKDGPTFSGPLENSWIDLTITSLNLSHRLKHWSVSTEDTQSDHNLIVFKIFLANAAKGTIRHQIQSTRKYAIRAGKWDIFK